MTDLAATDPAWVLRRLAEVAERSRADPAGANAALVALAAEVSAARGAFLARVEGDGLRLLVGSEAGRPLELSGKQLERVAAAVREALDGVSAAPPPHLTGGRPPRGAVAVKAEAGHPPVYAFPLRAEGAWEGVLGLLPAPGAPPEPEPAVEQALLVVARLLDPRLEPAPARGEAGERGEGTAPLRAGLKHDYGEIVTQSEKVLALLRKLDRVIGAKVPVLITGETGTGKELIARAIHRNDPQRRQRRLYAQNCGAIAATLLESELFGYEKGTFTGAEAQKKGLFEVASGSTLFLDEIGEMSLDMQTRFLRVLQEGEVVRLGGTEPIKVDVRIVAATLRDLEADIRSGRFREDLYYRLKVVRIALPPLRERKEDVVLLVDHFLRKAAREVGRRPKVLDRRDARVLEALTEYPWPGNIRELENVIRRLAYLAPGDVIGYEALAEADPHLVGAWRADEAEAARPVRPLDVVVEEAERAEIDNALRVTSDNRSQAARLLGINRRSLLRRLQKYGYAAAGEGEGEEGGEGEGASLDA